MNSQPASQPACVSHGIDFFQSITPDGADWILCKVTRFHLLLLKVHAVVSESATPRLQEDPACIHEVGLNGLSATSGDCAARQTCSSLRFSFSFLSMFRPHDSLLIRVMCLHVSPLLYNEKKTFVVSDSNITMKKIYLFLCKCV